MSSAKSVSVLVAGKTMAKRMGRPKSVVTGRQQPVRKELYCAKSFLDKTRRRAKSAGMSWNKYCRQALQEKMDRET